jgi:hypothetical protein
MRRLIIVLLAGALSVGSGRIALAQPGMTAPRPPLGLALLTDEERELIVRGEIAPQTRVAGALLGAWIGFGVGHAVQGRFGERGWTFLLLDTATVGLLTAGALNCVSIFGDTEPDQCDGDPTLLVGLGMLLVVRTFETIDLLKGPSRHNERVRRAREKAYGPSLQVSAGPTADAAGGQVGLLVRFLDAPAR